MGKKPDAYELEYSGRGANVVKCMNCGFKAVKYQWDDVKEKNSNKTTCPACKHEGQDIVKGKSHKKI